MAVALQLIGGFRAVRDDGQVVQMPDRSRALLAHLALAVTPIQRTVLAAVLSPDECEPDQRRKPAASFVRRSTSARPRDNR